MRVIDAENVGYSYPTEMAAGTTRLLWSLLLWPCAYQMQSVDMYVRCGGRCHSVRYPRAGAIHINANFRSVRQISYGHMGTGRRSTSMGVGVGELIVKAAAGGSGGGGGGSDPFQHNDPWKDAGPKQPDPGYVAPEQGIRRTRAPHGWR